MSRTDKDAPWKVRKERGEVGDTWLEKGSGEKGVRLAKKDARRARRRGITHVKRLKSLTQTYIYNSS